MHLKSEKLQVVASIVLYKHTYAQLQDTLSSLLSETCVKMIILVDNGGSDWAATLNEPRICYIATEQNKGFGYGHNLAMKLYLDKSDYFLICNPDISFQQGELERLYQFARSENHQFVSPCIYYDDGRLQYSCRLLPQPANLFLRRFFPRLGARLDVTYEVQHADYKKSFSVPSVSGCFMFVDSTLMKKLGGFDERYFMYLEDIDLCRRALSFTDIIFYPDSTIVHAFGKGSYKSLSLFYTHVRSAILYFNKWGWFFDKQRKLVNQRCLNNIPMSTSIKDT